MRKLLAALCACFPFAANAIHIETFSGVLAADTTASTHTSSGQGTPDCAFIVGSYATAVGTTPAAGASVSIGVSDFTTTASVAVAAEDNVADTDTDRIHDKNTGGNGYFLQVLTPGLTTLARAATVATTTDGISITPSASGTAFRYQVTVIWSAEGCTAFSAGDGTLASNTFTVAHGFGAADSIFGVFGYVAQTNASATNARFSIGIGEDTGSGIDQRTMGIAWQNAQIDGEAHAQMFTDVVASLVNNSGESFHEIAWTSTDSTNATFTVATATSSDLVGLLVRETTENVWVGTVTSPNSAASDWNVTSPNFTPQYAMMLYGEATTADTAMTDSAPAGVFGSFQTDFTTTTSLSFGDENAADPTNTYSNINTGLYFFDDAQTALYNATSPTAETTGLQISAANITTASATSHLWPGLFVEAVSSSGLLLRRRR